VRSHGVRNRLGAFMRAKYGCCAFSLSFSLLLLLLCKGLDGAQELRKVLAIGGGGRGVVATRALAHQLRPLARAFELCRSLYAFASVVACDVLACARCRILYCTRSTITIE